MKPDLWTLKPVKETIQIYRDWADQYDADILARGYHTPQRIAETLRKIRATQTPVLDFGCGTGLSGRALADLGIGPLHGTDITAEMLEYAKTKGIYETLWLSEPGLPPSPASSYDTIVAAGVISLGAAPPQAIDLLVDTLRPDGLLLLSFNDPTLADGRYDAHLVTHVKSGRIEIVSRNHGPHIDDVDMGSDIIVLRRR